MSLPPFVIAGSGPETRTLEERKAAYEQSALKQLMESTGHQICPRCYCCDQVSEGDGCWQCMGSGFVEDDWDDSWGEEVLCPSCHGDGEIFYEKCLGDCDENGNHAAAPVPDPEHPGDSQQK